MMQGVRAGLGLPRTGDARRALAERNPQLAPHLSFVDVGGHGYSVVRAGVDELEVEFVCIPRPLERTEREDGGPLAYRVAHRVKRWGHADGPRLDRTKVEGTLPLVFESETRPGSQAVNSTNTPSFVSQTVSLELSGTHYP